MSEVAQPSLEDINTNQSQQANLRSALAASHEYLIGKRVHFGGAAGAVLIALGAPFVLIFAPSAGPSLGALAGIWIFVSRLVLEPIKNRLQLRGARAQEMFDTAVLCLDWNDAICRRLPEEEIRAATGNMKGVEKVEHWYSATHRIGWPNSVLLCQRANAVWGRRQHSKYAWALLSAAALWVLIGVGIAAAHGSNLAEYLVVILLPSLPALLDAAEMAQNHLDAASRREILEDHLENLLRDGIDSATDLREIQDQIFNLRRNAPLVPEWFYRIVKTNFEADMKYATERAAESTGAGVGSESQPFGHSTSAE